MKKWEPIPYGGPTGYRFAPDRGLWEAVWTDDDGQTHFIEEFCETDHEAMRQCAAWLIRNMPQCQPPF